TVRDECGRRDRDRRKNCACAIEECGAAEREERHRDRDVAERGRPAAVPFGTRTQIEKVQAEGRDAEAETFGHCSPADEGEDADEVQRRLKRDACGAVDEQSEETTCDVAE